MSSLSTIPAIIPARGGSKGIPGKNTRPLHGQPLISHTIQAALAAQSIGTVLLSTDDPDIAKVGKAGGAWAPFLRPPELAGDDVPMVDVILHSLDWLESEGGKPIEAFCLLQPTSPLRTAAHVDAAIDLFHRTHAESVLSVTEFEHSVHWALRVSDQGMLSPRESSLPMLRQEAETFYRPNGAIYIAQTRVYREQRSFFIDRARAFIMDAGDSVDIDTDADLHFAEFLLHEREHGG